MARYGDRMSELDFWVGDWDAEWDGGRGRNTVTRELGGRVYVERFRAGDDESFEGMSLSVRDDSTGAWRQTWADSDGGYWAFVGRAPGGRDLRLRHAGTGRRGEGAQAHGVLGRDRGQLRLALGVLGRRERLGAAMGDPVPEAMMAAVEQHTDDTGDPGSGVPLVLLHAFPLTSAMWSAQVAALSGRARVVTPDLRGFGGLTARRRRAVAGPRGRRRGRARSTGSASSTWCWAACRWAATSRWPSCDGTLAAYARWCSPTPRRAPTRTPPARSGSRSPTGSSGTAPRRPCWRTCCPA